MAISRNKYDGMNPSIYDTAIKEQRGSVRKHPKDAEQWLELGRLCEAKIETTHSFAKSNFIIRYFTPIYLLSILFVVEDSTDVVC